MKVKQKYVGGKMLRCGYTTGSCAAAAAAAAARMLLSGEKQEFSSIRMPDGEQVSFEVHEITLKENSASCCVIKDAGDDIDITDGTKVAAKVFLREEPGIKVTGGKGVGRVTKEGLKVAPGNPAINPVPLKMIRESVEKALQEYEFNLSTNGLQVEISVPDGERLAKQTFNPRLGVEGGISILGTTGRVLPMSREAILETQYLELSQLKSRLKDKKQAVFVPGNYGFDYARKLGIPEERIVKISNFPGKMLDKAVELGFDKVLIIGDLGKLIKLAGGIFQTHSSESDARLEILAAHAAALGADQETVLEILDAPTTVKAVEIIKRKGLDGVYDVLAKRAQKHCERRVFSRLSIELIIFSGTRTLAGTDGAAKLIKEVGIETNTADSRNRPGKP